MLRVGVASCFFHADPQRPIFRGKTLLYLVQDVGQWLLSQGVMPILLPTLTKESALTLRQITSELDGLVLQGGSDVAPESYGEKPLKPEWAGDRARDLYEIDLVTDFLEQHKPILGLCRGLQLLNVVFKGTLYQDIGTQIPGALKHRDWENYSNTFHSIDIAPGSGLAKLYPGEKTVKVNTIHHQAIKDLGKGLRAEAFAPDQVIEAVRLEGPEYVVGVQWHPEFQDPNDQSLLSTKPLLAEFITEAKKRKRTSC